MFRDYAPGQRVHRRRTTGNCPLTLLMRAGWAPEYKRKFIQGLWKLLQTATGAADDQSVIGIQEVPASQAMEMRQVMPEIASEYGEREDANQSLR